MASVPLAPFGCHHLDFSSDEYSTFFPSRQGPWICSNPSCRGHRHKYTEPCWGDRAWVCGICAGTGWGSLRREATLLLPVAREFALEILCDDDDDGEYVRTEEHLRTWAEAYERGWYDNTQAKTGNSHLLWAAEKLLRFAETVDHQDVDVGPICYNLHQIVLKAQHEQQNPASGSWAPRMIELPDDESDTVLEGSISSYPETDSTGSTIRQHLSMYREYYGRMYLEQYGRR